MLGAPFDGDPVGPWALVTRVATIQRVAAPGIEPYGSVTHSFAVVDVRLEGDELLLSERGCRLKITVVLGASNPALEIPILIEPDPDPAQSVVELVRLAEPLDCDGLVEHLGELFPADR